MQSFKADRRRAAVSMRTRLLSSPKRGGMAATSEGRCGEQRLADNHAMKHWQAVCLALLAACSPRLDWRDVRLDGVTVQMPCKPEHLQRDAQVGSQVFKVRMHVCDAAGASWAVLEVDTREAALAAAARADLQRALMANLESVGETAGQSAFSSAAGGASQPWQVVRGRRADGSAVIASVSYGVDGARVLQRVALLPREASAADVAGLEMFHASVAWGPR